MRSLGSKLSLGFGGLLLVALVIGTEAILLLGELGQSIDVILRENYRSVLAAQEMKEYLERVDSGILFVLLGYEQEGKTQIDEYLAKFDKSMGVESGNITLPDENEAVKMLEGDYRRYRGILSQVGDGSRAVEERRKQYFAELLPLFQSIKSTADRILQMNQQNMSDANMNARHKAARASQSMYLLLVCGGAVAAMYIFFVRRWILRPIAGLINSAEEIRKGNLDLVVGSTSQDEIGQLSKKFDAMTASLRESRRKNMADMLRLQRAMEQAFDSLPDPLALVDLNGMIEMATNVAATGFGIRRNMTLRELPYPHAAIMCDEVMTTGRAIAGEKKMTVQQFIGGKEYFFVPKAVPILDDDRNPVGAILILQDVTPSQQQDEMKRGLISTVSHQLKTPLTSIRMALYLLLDDKLGTLTSKQEELLIAARDDSDRLNAIVEDLLDIARIQSGRLQIEFRNADAAALALDAIEPFKVQAQDRGIAFSASIPAGLPEVQADVTRIPHVFANLLSNALKYTAPGGSITVSARAEGEAVWYSVSDTGAGIPPEYQARVFEQFFRVPQEGKESGAGLGLAIAKEIVTSHGGEVRVESQPGKGSTFSFSLKQAAAAPPEHCS